MIIISKFELGPVFKTLVKPNYSYQHTHLTDYIVDLVLENSNASTLLEIGSFQGGSTLLFARHLKDRSLNSALLSIDPHLAGIVPAPNFVPVMPWGQPGNYFQLLVNILDHGHEDVIVPVQGLSSSIGRNSMILVQLIMT